MKRSRNDHKTFGPAAAAMRRSHIYRDTREAEAQLSAKQLIDDAVAMHKFQAPSSTVSTKVLIRSKEELALYRQKRRSELDEKVNRGYKFLGNWVKYARWEAQQKDYVRMRQVLERAAAVHGDNPKFWRDYAELEQAQGFLPEARAVWGRGIAALPHAADLWLKAALMEQAAGDTERARDLLQRWTTLPSPPSFAFELFTLLEVQVAAAKPSGDPSTTYQRAREVLRRYVEHANTPEAWLFYAATEADALQNPSRAVQVLETAREALPAEELWTSLEHRVPLRLAQLYASEGRKEEARALYRELLERLDRPARSEALTTTTVGRSSSHHGSTTAALVVDQRVVSDILAEYAQFERLSGGADAAAVEELTRIQAKRFYTQRLQENPLDLDSRLSLYLLLRGSSQPEQQAEALACLRGVTAVPLQGDPYRAQQAVVLLMEYARASEAAGATTDAQHVLAQALQKFPFEEADCPRLWEEAAALEERLGHVEQARKMLRAAMHVTKDSAIVDALLQLEGRAYDQGAFTDREAYLAQLRQLYRDVLKLDPLRVSSWVGLAKLEEKEGQTARAQAVYDGAVRTLTAEACKQLRPAFAYRYELLDQVDQLWGRRMALGQRVLRRLRSAAAPDTAVEEQQRAVDSICLALLDDVWAGYRFEAMSWYSEVTEGDAAIPVAAAADVPALPEKLQPAMNRFADAMNAAVQYFTDREAAAPTATGKGLALLRAHLQQRVQQERDVLAAALRYDPAKVGYDKGQILRRWSEVLLSPLIGEWGRIEVLYGDRSSRAAVEEAVGEPAKKRTRLFKNRK